MNGLGSESLPKRVDIRIMEFLPILTNTVFEPTDTPIPGQRITMKTFWSNLGKREGRYRSNYGRAKVEKSGFNPPSDNVEVSLDASETSLVVEFVYEPTMPGVPVLYVIDADNFENLAYPVDGMIVSSADVDSVSSGDSLLAYTMIASIAVITILVGGYMVSTASSRVEEEYYDEDYEDYDEENEDGDYTE